VKLFPDILRREFPPWVVSLVVVFLSSFASFKQDKTAP